MSLLSLQDAKEQVRQALDVVDVVGGYVGLRRQGRGYVALCPWHDDSRPSLQVNPDRQSWKCWVCNVGGDIFSFVMKAEGLEFREALEMLAERAGVSLAPAAKPRSAAESQFDRRNLLRAMAWAEQQFHECLLKDPAAEPARRYLLERGLSSESVARFRLGFAPPAWDWLLKRANESGISDAVLERVDCAVRRDGGGFYDRFRGRLIFSIRDLRSRPVAFGGRVLPEFARQDDAKYINSRETPLFNKSSHLYGLDLAKDAIVREKCALVMEGYTDVIMAHQNGLHHAVAVLGTALGERHVPLMRRFADSVTLVLDGDAAGQNRTMEILDNLLALFVAHDLDLKILTLPSGADPCDVISSHGCDSFRRLLAQSVDALQHKIEAVTKGLVPGADAHRSSQAVEAILTTLARALPAAVASSAALIREQQVLVRVARQFGVSEEALRSRFNALRRSPDNSLRGSRRQNPAARASDSRSPRPSAWDVEFVEVLLLDPTAIETLVDDVTPDDVASPAARTLFAAAVEMMQAGVRPTFDRLMAAVEDESAKTMLVDCDEKGRKKTSSDVQQRVGDLVSDLNRRRQDARHQAVLAELKQNQLDPEQADRALASLFDDLKRRQAISPPMDG